MDTELEAAAGDAREHAHLLSEARRRMKGDARTIIRLEARMLNASNFKQIARRKG
jgi:hypothetical protein